MKKPLQHEIDSNAKAYLESLFPHWVVNQINNDYGKDYLIEITNQDRNLTGISFFVQLKGTQKVTQTRKGISFTFDSKHIKYYVDNVKDLPVFLFLVDTTTKRGWWLFLQRHFFDFQVTSKNVSVNIPKHNTFDDLDNYIIEVEKANAFMRGSHPTVARDILATENHKATNLDPRFFVRSISTSSEGHVSINLNAREHVDFSLTFDISDAEKRKKVIELTSGELVAFKPSDVTALGSPLIESFIKDEFALKIDTSGHFDCDIIALKDDTQLIALRNFIASFKSITLKEFEISKPEMPCKVFTRLSDDLKSGNSRYTIDISIWEGKGLLNLPWFDEMSCLLDALAIANKFEIQFKKHGAVIAGYKSNYVANEQVAGLNWLIKKIKLARDVAQAHNINPAWSLKMFEDDFTTINMMHFLSSYEKSKLKMPGLKLTLAINESTDYKSWRKKRI